MSRFWIDSKWKSLAWRDQLASETCNQIARRDSVSGDMETNSTSLHQTPDLSGTYQLLRLTYGIVPFLAGLDKFFNLLTDWEKYIPPIAAHLLVRSVRGTEP